MDSDGIYFYQICQKVESGVFQMYMTIHGADGSTGSVKWDMAWDPSGHFAYKSTIQGEMTSGDASETYTVSGDFFGSDLDKKIQMTLGLNADETILMFQEFGLRIDFARF